MSVGPAGLHAQRAPQPNFLSWPILPQLLAGFNALAVNSR